MNDTSSKVSSLETSKKRLESQVDNLIEAVGKSSNRKETVTNGREKKALFQTTKNLQIEMKKGSQEKEDCPASRKIQTKLPN